MQGRIISQREMNAGYMIVVLYVNNKAHGRLVHRLVAESFIGPCPDGKEVNHIDGCKKNNTPTNLEYVTRSQNLLHAVATTGAYRGERNSQAIITPAIVREIRRQRLNGMSYNQLARHFDLSWGLVRGVVIGRTWAHVT